MAWRPLHEFAVLLSAWCHVFGAAVRCPQPRLAVSASRRYGPTSREKPIGARLEASPVCCLVPALTFLAEDHSLFPPPVVAAVLGHSDGLMLDKYARSL